MRDRESFPRLLEERLTWVRARFSERRHGAEPGAGDLRGPLDAIRGELARMRRSIGAIAHEDLARVRRSLEGFRGDYDVPPPHFGLRREELEVFRGHLATVARLLPTLSNLDDPRWEEAHEEYERSWAEVQRAAEPEGDATAP